MRRFLYVGTWFTALFWVWTTTFAAEQITLTTYYPSPVGDYQTITTGKLNIDLSNPDDAAGTATIPGGVAQLDVSTNRVTASSLIFLTIGPDASAGDKEPIHVESVTAGSGFRVSRSIAGIPDTNPLTFSWLVIN